VLLEANEGDPNDSGLLEIRLHAEGKFAKKLWIEAPGSGFTPTRMSHELIEQRRHFPRMEGRFVFKHAVKRMPEVLLEALSAASLKLDDVDLFLFHQANLRINEFVIEQLASPPSAASTTSSATETVRPLRFPCCSTRPRAREGSSAGRSWR